MDYAYDINYARKYFFTLDEFEEYFLYYDLIFQQAKNSSDRQIIEELEKIVRRLDSKGMKSVLLEDISNTQKTKEALLKYIMSPKLSYDNICSVTENYKVFFNKYVYQSETIKKKKINYVNNVRKIILNNFRENCFGENKETEELIKFCNENDINDLHCKNFGCDGFGDIYIIDFSGYRE